MAVDDDRFLMDLECPSPDLWVGIGRHRLSKGKPREKE
jgi:hypothetical protein